LFIGVPDGKLERALRGPDGADADAHSGQLRRWTMIDA
jgi:hypothetical protein